VATESVITLIRYTDELSELAVSYQKDNSRDSLDAVTQKLEEIGTYAGDNSMPGFQDVCFLLQDFLLETPDGSIYKATQQQQLVNWIDLVKNYINQPDDSNSDNVLNIFRVDCWPAPLLETDTNFMKEMLVIPDRSPEDEISEQEQEKSEHIQSTIKSCYTELNQIINHEDISNIDSLGKLSQAINEFAQSASKELSLGFQDICILLDENILELIEQRQGLTNAHKNLLVAWIDLAGKYINDPENNDLGKALLLNLEDQQWCLPLGHEDSIMIADMMGIKLEDGKEDKITEISSDISPENNHLGQLRQALNKYSSDDNSTLEIIIKHMVNIGSFAAETNLHGFQDVCLLIQQNLEDIADENNLLSEAQLQALLNWTVSANKYVSNPEDASISSSLIEILTESHWPTSLTDDDTIIIKEMFDIIDDSTQTDDSLADEAVVDIKPESTPVEVDADVSAEEVSLKAEACPVSPMLVDMLLEEMKHIEEDIEETTPKITSKSVDKKLRSDALLQLAVRLERFGNACQAAELAGLYQATEIIQKNIVLIEQEDAIASQNQSDLIKSWPNSVKEYLFSLGDNNSSENIVEILSSDAWLNSLMNEVAPALINLLNAPYSSEEEAKEDRQTQATADDVSLELPTDISQELLDGLLQELPSQTEGFSSALQAIIDGSGDSKEIEKAQRIAHTVKGAANTVGIRGIATLTHQLEDIFQFLNQHNKLPSEALALSLINASDCLEEMSESLMKQGDAPENAQEILQDILNWINRLENEGIEVLEGDPSITTKTTSKDESKEKPDAPEDEQAAIATLRVEAPIIDDLIRILGETIILTTQLQDKIRNSAIETGALIKQNEASHELINQLEQQIELRGVSNVSQAVNQNEIFDALELEEYNELHTITNQLVETTLDSVELNREIKRELHELDELVIDQSRLHREIQRLVMRTRMVPIKTITPRLQRSVRQTCRTLGKQAALHLSGTDTLIDSDILNNLVDPLIHMLRNSLDHGIEDRDERISKNKDPEGKIDLSFSSEGTEIIVRCQDDGAGLDHDLIHVTAIKRNLIEPHDKPTPLELDRMILKPGFSTSNKTTQVSGRGIGMDLVYSQILACKGTLHIESEKDKGCLIELRMPVTLISTHVLIIRHRNKMLAISSRGVEQILHPSDSQIIDSENGLMCKLDDEILELSNLENLIDFPGDRRMNEREPRPALLIREEDINKVVYIQEIVDSRELVIKSMGKYMSNVRGVPGATILGDGSVVPVLDIPELIRTFTQNEDRIDDDDFEQTGVRAALPTALVVDDSLSARRALAQVVGDAGYDVRTAKDGIEAIEIIDKKTPDILLVDMEMPRMNGLELAAHVRANPITSDIPIIMVTSRSTEKHREQAKSAGVNIHLTKPFSEDVLLDHISNLLN